MLLVTGVAGPGAAATDQKFHNFIASFLVNLWGPQQEYIYIYIYIYLYIYMST